MAIERIFGSRPRILVFGGARPGDFLTLTPAFRAIRAALPEATIGLITSAANVELAHRYTSLDIVFTSPYWPGEPETAAICSHLDAFFESMRAWHADVALQCIGGGENSNRLLRLLGARLTAGTRHPSAPDLALAVPHSPTKVTRLGHLDILAAFGIYPDSLDLDFPLLPSDDLELMAAMHGQGSPSDRERRPLLGIHPGSRSAARR